MLGQFHVRGDPFHKLLRLHRNVHVNLRSQQPPQHDQATALSPTPMPSAWWWWWWRWKRGKQLGSATHLLKGANELLPLGAEVVDWTHQPRWARKEVETWYKNTTHPAVAISTRAVGRHAPRLPLLPWAAVPGYWPPRTTGTQPISKVRGTRGSSSVLSTRSICSIYPSTITTKPRRLSQGTAKAKR